MLKAKRQTVSTDQEVERPDVEIHDEVYFRSPRGPLVGRVSAVGQHGCHVHDGKTHHKVKWEHLLGHKVRVRPEVKVVDQGEDGLIVEDPRGRRRYVHDPMGNDPPKGEMHKALVQGPGGRLILFTRPQMMKASGAGRHIKNGAGLTLQAGTDKAGNPTHRWKKTGAPPPKERPAGAGGDPASEAFGEHNLQAGDKVTFKAGDFAGKGTIVGVLGEDGCHVKDSSGRQHTVHYGEITGHKGADDGQKPAPEAAGPGGGDGGGDKPPVDRKGMSVVKDKPGVAKPTETDDPDEIARTMFDTSEMEKLPKKVNQPIDNWDDLLSKGKVGLEEYRGMLGKVAKSLNLVTGKRPASHDFAQEEENEKAKEEGRAAKTLNADDYMLPEHWDDPHGYLFIGPLKGRKRALEKVQTDYTDPETGYQDWSQIRDMVRATIAVPAITQVPAVIKALKDQGIVPVQQPKNNFIKPLPGGYRDVNMIVRLPNGLLAEMQIHVKPMTLAKEHGHHHYETSRTIEAKYKKDGVETPREQWDGHDKDEHGKAMAEQERIYGAAWEKAKNPAGNS